MKEQQRRIPIGSPEAIAIYNQHALPLAINSGDGVMPWDKKNWATFSLVRLPERDVCITCNHVYERLLEVQRNDPAARIVAYPPGGDFPLVELNTFELIDREGPSLDVAVFGGLEPRISLPNRRFIDYRNTYIPDPVLGESVMISGYPSSGLDASENRMVFGHTFICFRASSITERQIILANEHGDRTFEHSDDPTRTGTDLGGMSGSPAFMVRDGKLGFVGIVTDCSGSSDNTDGTIIISRLGCLNPDGTLDHHAIAW